MTRLEKAAAFGAMMGKRAGAPGIPGNSTIFNAPVQHTEANLPNQPTVVAPQSAIMGGRHNRVGTLPSATTEPRVPLIGGADLSKKPSLSHFSNGSWNSGSEAFERLLKPRNSNPMISLNTNAYNNFLHNNYSRSGYYRNPMGVSRGRFHNDLRVSLDHLDDTFGSDGKNLERWDKRMGELASEVSNKAPIPHVQISGEDNFARTVKNPPFSRSSLEPHAAFANLTKPMGIGSLFNPLTYMPSQDRVQYAYTTGVDAPFKKTIPTFTDNLIKTHENTHAGYQNMENVTKFTNNKGVVAGPQSRFSIINRAPNNSSTIVGDQVDELNTVMPAQKTTHEAGAVFNEIGQAARAYRDVTGKRLEGHYRFSPNTGMDYSELGDLAKKYKPTDLNSPSGQIFLRNILKDSTGPVE